MTAVWDENKKEWIPQHMVDAGMITHSEAQEMETNVPQQAVTKEMYDRQELEKHFLAFLSNIKGEDANRDGLKETPARMAKAYMDELLTGYSQDPESVLKTFESVESTGLVLVTDIPVYSLCEHHVLPFVGKAHIAYIPSDRILGLSKFARLVDIYARRLQVQERLTKQVADCLHEGLNPKGVMVIMQAEHMCMSLRGAQAPGTLTTTSEIRGLFRDVPALREEAMKLIQMAI